MTKRTHEEIAALLAGITPGEWSYCEQHQWVSWGDSEPPPIYGLDGPIFASYSFDAFEREADAKFIAAAPDMVKQLLTEVERLRIDRDEWHTRATSPPLVARDALESEADNE